MIGAIIRQMRIHARARQVEYSTATVMVALAIQAPLVSEWSTPASAAPAANSAAVSDPPPASTS